MESKKQHYGILFNSFYRLVCLETNIFNSEADMLLQVVRFMAGDQGKSITSDQQIFRDIRSGVADDSGVIDLFVKYSPGKKPLLEQHVSLGVNSDEYGAWVTFRAFITGVKGAIQNQNVDINEQAIIYLDFLLAHCDLERSFLSKLSGPFEKDRIQMNTIINKWLLTDNLDAFAEDRKGSKYYEYIISMVLHWTAFFEVFMHQVHGKDNNCELFSEYLPQIDAKGKLVSSNERQLITLKDYLTEKFNKKLKWTDVSSIIAKARRKNGLAISANSDEVYSEGEVNQMILQKLKRWRKGYKKNGERHLSFITIDDLKQYIDVVEHKYVKEEYDASVFIIGLLQIWEKLQFDCKKLKIPNKLIVDTFAKYPEYVALVEKRFSKFEVTKKLSP